jgi:hypothetical protein
VYEGVTASGLSYRAYTVVDGEAWLAGSYPTPHLAALAHNIAVDVITAAGYKPSLAGKNIVPPISTSSVRAVEGKVDAALACRLRPDFNGPVRVHRFS